MIVTASSRTQLAVIAATTAARPIRDAASGHRQNDGDAAQHRGGTDDRLCGDQRVTRPQQGEIRTGRDGDGIAECHR